MKKVAIASVFILTAIILQAGFNTYSRRNAPICRTFAGTGAIADKGLIEISGILYDRYYSEKDCKEILLHLASKTMDVEDEEARIKVYGQGYELRLSNDKEESFKAQLINDTGDYRIFIEFESKDVSEELLYRRKNLVAALRSLQAEISFNGCVLCGKFPGKLSGEKMSAIADEAMKDMGVADYEATYTQDMLVCYGYSYEIPEYITFKSERSNINIVFTYDEEGYTNIYLASPVMNAEY